MGSSRSFRSFYSRGSGSDAYKHSRNPSHTTDIRLNIPNPSKYSPAKSSIYERIMRRPRSPDKHTQSNPSTFERKPAKLPPPGYDNPLIGRLVLTPVSELNLQEKSKINTLQLPTTMGIDTQRNSLILLQRQNSRRMPRTPVQEIPTYVYQTTETNNKKNEKRTRTGENTPSTCSASSSQGSASTAKVSDKEEEHEEVFV